MSRATGAAADAPPRGEAVGLLAAWRSGWEAALRMPGVLVLKWLVNLAFAVAVGLPVALALQQQFGHSVVGEQAFERIGTDAAAEFAVAYDAPLRLAAMALVPIALGYLFLNLYLTGGILSRLCAGRREPWAEFFGACNRHFSMLVRVGLWTLPLAAAVVGLPHYGLARLVERLTEGASSPQPLFYLTWVHWTVLFLLGSWVARVYDYARVAVCLETADKARTAVVRGLAFTLRSGTRTLVLWGLLVLPPLALTVLFATAPITGGVRSITGAWVSVMLGQALLALRIAGSFAALGGQMRFMSGVPVATPSGPRPGSVSASKLPA